MEKFLNAESKHESNLAEWTARGEKNAGRQGKRHLEAISRGLHSLVSNIINRRWQQEIPNIGSTFCWTFGDDYMG